MSVAQERRRSFFGLANIDFDGGEALEPKQPGPSGKRRGRPPGSRGRTVEDNTPITPGDMAFLRAWVQGISPERAAAQYLGPGMARHKDAVLLYTRGLFRRICTSRLTIGGSTTLTLLQELNAPLPDESMPAAPLLAAPPPAVPAARPVVIAAPTPTLEEWIADHPEWEEFSFEEQLEAYKADCDESAAAANLVEAAAPVADQRAPIAVVVEAAQTANVVVANPGALAAGTEMRVASLRRKLAAIDTLASAVVTTPTGDSALHDWISKPLADTFREKHGLLTLANLVLWINLRGRHWYYEVPKLGRDRAHRLVSWLVVHRTHIGVDLVPRVLVGALQPEAPPYTGLAERPPAPLQRDGEVAARGALAQLPKRSGFNDLVLEGEGWAQDLTGVDGVFRQRAAPNTTGATNDLEALREYDRVYLSAQSEGTRVAYRRALERLVFWAQRERFKPISSLTTDDFAAYKVFLADPPGHWRTRFPVVRSSPDWRPFRGKLSESSVRQQMAIVASFMARLFRTGYLSADACAFVPQVKGRAQVLDTTRSFSDPQLEVVRRTYQALEEGPWKNRVRAAILLLQTTGLRLAEAVAADFERLVPRSNRDTGALESYEFTFTGKGNKRRTVFVPIEAYEALAVHYADRYALTQLRTDPTGKIYKPELPARYARSPGPQGPLLGVVQRLRNVGTAGPGDSTADAIRSDNPDGRLAERSLHSMLVRFFGMCSRNAGSLGDQEAFERASAHWLRHTFAKDALRASGNQLAPVQQLLGHASLNTTGVYLKTNTDERFAAVKRIRRAL